MQTVSIENFTNSGFFRQILKPDEHRNSVSIPKELFGKTVEVVIFPVLLLESTSDALEKMAVRPPFEFGSMSGKIWMADDFDAPLEEFKEYM